MMNFSDLKYSAPDTTAIHDQLRKIRLRMRMSLSVDGIIKSLHELDSLLRELEEKYLISQINFAKAPNDEYWQLQYESFVRWAPFLKINLQETLSILVDHKLEQDITELVGGTVFTIAKTLLACYGSLISEELQELVQCRWQYIRIIRELGLQPRGFARPAYQLRKLLTQPDKERRGNCYKQWVLSFQNRRDELLNLYLRFLSLLKTIADKTGYARISDYLAKQVYPKNNAGSYQEISFAHALRKYFLPIQHELRSQQALRLGQNNLARYDQWMPTPEGEPIPLPDTNHLDSFKQCINKMFDADSGFLLAALDLADHSTAIENYERTDRNSFHLPVSDLPYLAYCLSPEGYHIYDILSEAGALCADTAAFRNRSKLLSWYPDRDIREVCAVAVETLSSDFCEIFFADYAIQSYDIQLIYIVQEMMEAAALTLFEQEAFTLSDPDGRSLAEIWTREELRSGIAGPPWDDAENFLGGYGFLLHPNLFLQPLQYLTRPKAYIRIWSFKPFSEQGARKLGTALSHLLAGDTSTSDRLIQAGFSLPIKDLDLRLAAFNLVDRLQL
ncbi:MAG TPA: M3 family oligoendopeptidase [Clostridiaceae bacterium]|nr:M3 family oligoendopeptidase [Clostridiaceae bacterium]